MGLLKNRKEIWTKRLEEVAKYIDENDKPPSQHDKNKEIKQLGIWLATQKQNYSKKTKIMNIGDKYFYKYCSQFIRNKLFYPVKPRF